MSDVIEYFIAKKKLRYYIHVYDDNKMISMKTKSNKSSLSVIKLLTIFIFCFLFFYEPYNA